MRLDAAARRGALTPALPMPYPAFEKAGLKLRRSQMSLWVAAPGVGKTQMLHNIAHRMREPDPWTGVMRGTPSLYWSADTSQHDVAVRAMAMWSGQTTQSVAEHFGEPEWDAYFKAALGRSTHVDWLFDPAIKGPMILERVAAFAERLGEYPSLTVLDNLSNAVEDQNRALEEQTAFMVEAQKLARTSETHVAVLAHAKGIYETGDKPIPQGGVINNLAKLPEVMVTLHRPGNDPNLLAANITKNRGGRPDPGALHPIVFGVDFDVATVKGYSSPD